MLSRMPAKTNGAEAGKMILRNSGSGRTPSVRAVSMSTGSTPRAPCTVLIRTGKNTANAIDVIFIASPTPRNSTSGGTKAALGMGRSSSIRGSKSPYTRGQ